MSANENPSGRGLVIGIDGGGTRTRAQLADAQGNVLGQGEAGTSNPRVRGLPAARRELEQAITRAFENAQRPRLRVTALCIGLGGGSDARTQQELAEWARQEFAEHVQVMNDAEIALAAGTPENWGVALIAGTGSFAWGRSRDGKTASAGGWGYLIGDEGSGFDLARSALQAATQFADGRADPTTLLAAIMEFWNVAAPRELLAHVYRPGLTHAEIARVAPLVIAEAKKGDVVARQLVKNAANALTRAVNAVSRQLELPEPFPLAITGGLLIGSAEFRAEVIERLETQGSRAAPTNLVQEPVAGAVRLALALAGQMQLV